MARRAIFYACFIVWGRGVGRAWLAACPWFAAGPAMDALLNASSAVGADLPVRVERAMAAGAHVTNLGIAHRADDKDVLSVVYVFIDARRRGASAYVAWGIIALIPFVGLIAYLVLRPHSYAADREEQELDMALRERQLAQYGTCPQCGAPIENIQGDDKANKGIDDAHKLRRHELGNVLGHYWYLSEY